MCPKGKNIRTPLFFLKKKKKNMFVFGFMIFRSMLKHPMQFLKKKKDCGDEESKKEKKKKDGVA